MTESELLFERFCLQRKMIHHRVPTSGEFGQQRPDYRVRSRWRRRRWIWVEVKEIIPNREEAQQIALLRAGKVASFGTEPGKKMRSIIDSGAPQLRAVLTPRAPAIIVAYDTTRALRQHTDPYGVLTAMRGLDVMPVEIPRDPRESPRFGRLRAGGKRRMTSSANTSVSAIGVLYEYGRRATVLDLFHNPFAQTPLRAVDLDGPFVRHFAMNRNQSDWRRHWPWAAQR